MRDWTVSRTLPMSLMLSLVVMPPFVWGTQSKDDSDSLKRYTTCKVADDLRHRDITRVKYPGNYREIGDNAKEFLLWMATE